MPLSGKWSWSDAGSRGYGPAACCRSARSTALVAACGGFQANRDWLRKYWGDAADNFQIRWTGKVVPRYSETYTFFTQADDGIRLWVNGVQVINNWATQTGTVETSGTIALTAGTPVTVTLEYFEGTGNAAAKLLWQSASVYKQIIPTGRLRPM